MRKSRKGQRGSPLYNPRAQGGWLLYFAYAALLEPDELSAVCPGAAFDRVAHLPEVRMTFSITNAGWSGGLPSVEAKTANTVWGAIFNIPQKQQTALKTREESEGRHSTTEFVAIDRAGGRFEVVTFVGGTGDGALQPSVDYMRKVIEGARHWGLPGGWVAGLEELIEEPLI